MKKVSIGVLISVCAIMLLSWGSVGHQTIAAIAERHLTPQAKVAVTALLGSESLVEVSNWADNIRDQPAYANTAPWHYLNVPAGLNFTEFSKTVTTQSQENVYKAIERCKAELISDSTTKEQKIVALKFLVHFVGDIHQPMHVSHAEDKGGNTIQVQFDGRGTNLHALWDSRLIDHRGLQYAPFATEIDNANQTQVAKWQRDTPMQWAYESYQLSTVLYQEIIQHNKLDESYYTKHIGIVQQRLEMAGIRLAGILNELFKEHPMLPTHRVFRPSVSSPPTAAIALANVEQHIGEVVTVSGMVYGIKVFATRTLLNVGAAYPNQLLTVVLQGSAKDAVSDVTGKTIIVTGPITIYKSKPEMVITDSAQLRFK